MSTPIDPSICRSAKTFARASLTAVLSKSQTRLGDLEVPVVMHVYSDTADRIVLTVACTRHRMQHDKQKCEIRVFGENGKVEGSPFGSTLADFEERALSIVRRHFRLGPPSQSGATILLLQALHVCGFALSIIATAAAIAFVAYQVWSRPTALLESKNPGTVAAWLLPGSALFAVAVILPRFSGHPDKRVTIAI